MNKFYVILFLTLSSCLELENKIEYTPIINNDIDSIMKLADDAMVHIKKKKDNHQKVQNKLNQKVLDIIHVREFYKDSIDYLRELKLIDRDSVVYNYNIELVTITDTVRITLVDSICSGCMKKLNKKKSIFNIFKKKK